MTCVVDSHALVWYLLDDRRPGARAGILLDQWDTEIVVPTIALAELMCLNHHQRIHVSFDSVLARIGQDERCSVHPFDTDVLRALPLELEIHDAIICATAIVLSKRYGKPVKVVTRDGQITQSKIVDTVW
jgi:PIN domain nuclease of toxin-antitoxin system